LILPESNNFNIIPGIPIVLLSPLDWGLGHTTRCIPIIHELVQQGCNVIIACNSTQKALLIEEFPQLAYVHLQGYNLKYGKRRWGTLVRIFLQTPKILIRVNNENTWLNIFLKSQRIDLIISDNRFGLYAPGVRSVFITHQLYIKTGLGKLTDRLVQWLNYRRIQRFSTCWIPDHKGSPTLAGILSNPGKLPAVPIRYIGGLSRLSVCGDAMEPINLLIILSGPEPQRTIFENLLRSAVKQQPGKTVLVRGRPGESNVVQEENDLIVYNHAPAALLNQLICSSELVVSRSGYTTVMDLLKLGKKSILVPTPGQPEQEYLATHLYNEQLAYTVPQAHFSLSKAMAAARAFSYRSPVLPMEEYKTVVRELVEQLKKAEH
jgi:UDP-N-acetylglucosamine transferase subunit ALG13